VIEEREERRNVVLEKSFQFSLKIIKLYSSLKGQKEYDLARQLLRSGTSIGANIEEAQGAQSRKDFINKLSIAYKEARECKYWIRLLIESEVLIHNDLSILLDEVIELNKLLTSIINSSKNFN